MYYYAHITKRQFIVLCIFTLSIPFLAYGYLTAAKNFPMFFWPCGLKEYFHLYCPGCGGTHAVEALLRLDIVESFLYNPLVLYMVVCLLYYLFKTIVQLKKQNGNAYFAVHLGFLWVFVGLMVGIFIIRNFLLVQFQIDYLGELAQYW